LTIECPGKQALFLGLTNTPFCVGVGTAVDGSIVSNSVPEGITTDVIAGLEVEVIDGRGDDDAVGDSVGSALGDLVGSALGDEDVNVR